MNELHPVILSERPECDFCGHTYLIEEAQKLVIESKGYCPSEWGLVKQYPVDHPIAFCVAGGG